MMSRIQLLVLLLMAVVATVVSAEEEPSSQTHTRTKQRPKRIRGRRRLALPLDHELDDDWDWTIRAPNEDPHIHNPGKAGKSGKSGKSGKNPIAVETQSPSKAQSEDDDDDDDSSKPNKGSGSDDDTQPSKGKGDDDAPSSLDDDLASLHGMPSESPSARPSQAPGKGPTPQLIGIIPHPPTTQSTTTSADSKDQQAPIPSDDIESSVSNNATDGSSTTNAGMMIGVSVSSVGLIAVAMLLIKKRKKRTLLVLTASEVEDDDIENPRGGKRRKTVEDGVVEEEDDDIDDERGQKEALVSSVSKSRQAPATPGRLSPPRRLSSRVRDGVVEDEDAEGGAFTGVYKLREHYNLTGFLEATGVPWAIRSAASRTRPVHFITHEGNVITMKFKGIPRATYILDGPSVENVLRDRTFACKATYTVDSFGFEVQQKGVDNGNYDIQLRWTLSEDDMTVHLTMTAIFEPNLKKNKTREPVMCTQIYSRIGEF